jgi:hypothetical protein
MVQIFTMSRGKPITSWKYHWQPSFYLSIFYTAVNISLTYAPGQAVTITWWMKALKSDTKLRDLNNMWSFDHGIKEIHLSGRAFNFVALAGFFVTLAPINGPLLQRASTITTRSITTIKRMFIIVPDARIISVGAGSSDKIDRLSPGFAQTLYDNKQRRPINITHSGCHGTCKGLVLGLGYDIKCRNDTVTFNLTSGATDARNTTVFSTDFTYNKFNNGTWYFTTVFFNQTFQYYWGFVVRRNCTLRPATMNYPIVLVNNTISLDSNGSWLTDRTDTFRPVTAKDGLERHGGFWLYFNSLYRSRSSIWYDADQGVGVEPDGMAVFDHANFSDVDNSASAWISTFRDPTFDSLSFLREVSFHVAVLPMVNMTEDTREQWAPLAQPVDIQQTTTQIVYESQYNLLIIAVTVTLIAAVTVFNILWGWWHLGRDVSLSPVEIAKAFAAPSLAGVDPNAKVKGMRK